MPKIRAAFRSLSRAVKAANRAARQPGMRALEGRTPNARRARRAKRRAGR